MTLEDLEKLNPELVDTDALVGYTNTLVAENEYIKQQFQALLDRQDRVGKIWGDMILVINERVKKTQNGANSI